MVLGRTPTLDRWLDNLRRDLRYTLRTIRTSPGFVIVVILTLAIGIGANTAIVSLLHTVLLRELPVASPETLVFVRTAGSRGLGGAPPYPGFDRIRNETSFDRLRNERAYFAGMAAFAADELRVEVDGAVEQVFGQVVSGTYFDVLGLTPAAGRLMTADDERLEPPVAVIGYGYWQRRFGGASSALGRTVSFRDRAFTIVGVTPPGFHGLAPGRQVEVTLPITQEPAMIANAEAQWFNAVARLRPGVSPRQAAAQASASFQSFMNDSSRPGSRALARFDRIELTPASRGLDQLRARFGGPLFVLTLITGILLLIACSNLGGLLLVRGTKRTREFAVRLAMGASAQRLFAQLLIETFVLFLLGATTALFVAYAAIQGVTGLFATGRRPILLDVQFDWRLVAYTLGITLATGVLTGVWPAVRALRTDPQTALKTTEPRWQRLRVRRVMIAGQVALSLALLVAAALFAQTMLNLRTVDLGFTSRGVLTMSVDPALPSDTGAAAEVWMQWLDRVRGLPGVRSVSLSVLTPLSGRNTGVAIAVPGTSSKGETRLNHVSEDYLRTFGIDLVAGRSFTRQDGAGATKVIVLNETAAKAAFAGRSAIGERVAVGDAGRAPRSNVAARVIAEAMLPVGAGILIGLPFALLVARAAQRLLFGVTPADATSYVFGAGAMVLVAALATWLPVRRACGLDPAETLRRG